MSNAVEVVVLDMGGVVCEYVPERRLRALSDLAGRRPAAIDSALFGSGLDARAEQGAWGLDEAYAAVLEALAPAGAPVARDDLRRAWSRAFVPDNDLLAMVRRVRRPTALFTNNGPLIEDCLAHELSSVTTAFDRLLVSWRLGATKPHPDAFVMATAALGVAPGSVLFVDDSRANVDAATAAGWTAHHYRGTCALNDLFETHDLFATA
jgi:putative hydrolase of the HAD superfamily